MKCITACLKLIGPDQYVLTRIHMHAASRNFYLRQFPIFDGCYLYIADSALLFSNDEGGIHTNKTQTHCNHELSATIIMYGPRRKYN